jgi:homoserine kinase
MRAAFARMCGQPPGLRLRCVNRIPHGSGLGSSAAAIVAGVELARALTPEGSQLSEAAALDLASSMEGHPDNVAACLLGGMTVAWTEDDGAHATKVEPAAVYPVVFSTDIHSATDAARAVLPAQVPHGDAAFNLSRAGLLVLAMTGRPGLLLPATQDRLHQSQRRASMPASFDLMMRLRAAGIPAVISGAGSSVLALTVSDDQAERAVDSTPPGWTGRRMLISGGARLHLVPPSDTLE